MTDRELLEMAAKAAGIKLHRWMGDLQNRYLLDPDFDSGLAVTWNPLTDDGDAMRLAVMIPSLNLQWIIAEAWQAHNDQASRMGYVRRAIVRAAAAIGSAM